MEIGDEERVEERARGFSRSYLLPHLDLIGLTNTRASARIRAAKRPDDVNDVITSLPVLMHAHLGNWHRENEAFCRLLEPCRLFNSRLDSFLPRNIFFLSACFWRFVLARRARITELAPPSIGHIFERIPSDHREFYSS